MEVLQRRTFYGKWSFVWTGTDMVPACEFQDSSASIRSCPRIRAWLWFSLISRSLVSPSYLLCDFLERCVSHLRWCSPCLFPLLVSLWGFILAPACLRASGDGEHHTTAAVGVASLCLAWALVLFTAPHGTRWVLSQQASQLAGCHRLSLLGPGSLSPGPVAKVFEW